VARRKVKSELSVRSVVKLTGLSEHVLRAWESRHGAVVPRRSSGGTRRYSAEDVVRLRLLAAAVEAGHPIREAAPLSNAELSALAARPESAGGSRLDPLFAALDRLDGAALERQLGLQLSALGVRPFLETIALPFLYEIGERWVRGALRINEEHAASAALHAVLARAQRSVGAPGASCLVLATPSGERHELGILIVALCAQEHGIRVVYLGCDLPAEQIAEAAVRVRARAVGLGLVDLDPAAALREARSLGKKLPGEVELWLGGRGAGRLANLPDGAFVVSDLTALDTRMVLLEEPSGRNRT
jgi:DNA-binding transcriptional MerR regulator